MTLEERKNHWLDIHFYFWNLSIASKIIRGDKKTRDNFLFSNPMSDSRIKYLENKEKMEEVEKLITLIESEIQKLSNK